MEIRIIEVLLYIYRILCGKIKRKYIGHIALESSVLDYNIAQ